MPLVFWAVSELTLPMSHLMFLWTHRIVSPSAVLHSFFRTELLPRFRDYLPAFYSSTGAPRTLYIARSMFCLGWLRR